MKLLINNLSKTYRNGVKALDDVDALAENYRKKIQIVQRKHVANFDFAKSTSSSRPSSSASTKSSTINFLSILLT